MILFSPPSASTPQIPAWTFDPATNGTPAAGFFQLDNADPSAATTIYLSDVPKIGGLNLDVFFANQNGNTLLLLTNAIGKTYIYKWTSPWNQSGNVWNAVISYIAADSTALSGIFTLSFAPQAAAVPPLSSVLSASGITTFAQFLAVFGITPAPDGTVTPVTSISTTSGIVTADS